MSTMYMVDEVDLVEVEQNSEYADSDREVAELKDCIRRIEKASTDFAVDFLSFSTGEYDLRFPHEKLDRKIRRHIDQQLYECRMKLL